MNKALAKSTRQDKAQESVASSEVGGMQDECGENEA